MVFSLVVYGAPHCSQAPLTAFRFASSVLSQGHSLYRVFFFHAGASNGLGTISDDDEAGKVIRDWQSLAEQHSLDLVICIGSAQRAGVKEQTGDSVGLQQGTLAKGFQLAGLGQLADAAIKSDRLVSFGIAS